MKKDTLKLPGAIGCCLAWLAMSVGASASDWPQLQHDPQRTGFTRDEVAPPYRVAWYHNFQPERVSRHVQPVVYQGRVYVPTEMGNVYALSSKDGEVAWKASLGSSVQQSAACADRKVVVAALNGSVHALDAATGKPVWVFKAPRRIATFSQSPCIAEGKVFIACRQGVFYALDLADGKVVWQNDLEVPVYQSAAYNNGRVYIGGEDIRVRALRARDGRLLWASERLYGQSFREYPLVVTGGYVLARPMMAHPSREYFNSNWGKNPNKRLDYVFQATWTHFDHWSGKAARSKRKDVQSPFAHFYTQTVADVKAGKMPEILMNAQDSVVEHYRKHPYDQDLFVLKESDGKQAYVAPHFHCSSLPGTTCCPAVAADGTVVIPWIYITHCWARFDLKRQRVVEIMLTPRCNNGDETLNVSVGGRFLCVLHTNEYTEAAAYTGVFNFQDKTWSDLPRRIPRRMWQLTDACESGGAAASISDGQLYHVVFHQLAAFAHDRSAASKEKRP